MNNFTRTEKILLRITGKPDIPSRSYLYKKTIKYLFLVPKTQILRFIRFLFPSLKVLRDEHVIIFVGGLHRSGTSILYKLLQSHPDVSGISNTTVPEDEGQFLQTIYAPDNRYGVTFSYNKETHLDDTSDLITVENKKQMIAEWGGYWNMKKNILLEKSPSNLVRMKFLNKLFPKSYFITITRHPIATCLAVSKWTDQNLLTLIEHWLYAHKIFFKAHNDLSNSLWLRYEDFVLNPNKELTTIFNTIKIPVFSIDESKIHESNTKYLKKWEEMNISTVLLKKIEDDNIHLLKKLGYSLFPPYIIE